MKALKCIWRHSQHLRPAGHPAAALLAVILYALAGSAGADEPERQSTAAIAAEPMTPATPPVTAPAIEVKADADAPYTVPPKDMRAVWKDRSLRFDRSFDGGSDIQVISRYFKGGGTIAVMFKHKDKQICWTNEFNRRRLTPWRSGKTMRCGFKKKKQAETDAREWFAGDGQD